MAGWEDLYDIQPRSPQAPAPSSGRGLGFKNVRSERIHIHEAWLMKGISDQRFTASVFWSLGTSPQLAT